MQLPVAAYRQRLRRLAADVAATLGGGGTAVEAAAVLEQLQGFLYGRCGFRVASYGATALPSGTTVDHPGVWEKAGHAYLNEVLVTRVGEEPPPPLISPLGRRRSRHAARLVRRCAACQPLAAWGKGACLALRAAFQLPCSCA